MAELNLQQITDKLNSEFVGSVGRKLIFWYDGAGEFADDVDALPLQNAKVLHLAQDNQFYTKYFLERVDTDTNYLVYAPFPKPGIRENHLADTIRYSKEFFADRASLLLIDLGIDEQYKPVIQHYLKFFANKQRLQAFYDLGLDSYNQKTIEIALMSILCKQKTVAFEDVVRTVLLHKSTYDANVGEGDNPYLAEFGKYDLLTPFWNYVQDVFGYADAEPSLGKLAMSIFVTYLSKTITADVPKVWQQYLSFKSGSIVAFVDNIMNSTVYYKSFEALSDHVYQLLQAEAELAKLPVESLVGCGIFAGIDKILLTWMTERLLLEDVGAKLGELNIPQLAKERRGMHYGQYYRSAYFVMENAFAIIEGTQFAAATSLNALAQQYTETLYQLDRRYRYFYYHLDIVERDYSGVFDKLKELIENIYANDYLSKVCTNWSKLFATEAQTLELPKQVSFYSRHVQYAKEQLVVIISDALRYEVGVSLFEKLQADEKCTATLQAIVSVLPSITKYGMAALLPHKELAITESGDILVDGQKNATLEQRQAILQSYKPESRCVQYDEIKNMSKADLRSIFTRQDVVYIYHNQIDARGDKLSTENEVFDACVEAVEEIAALIRRLTTSANRSRFIITADHGFMYRRSKLTESDKIATGAAGNRRYIMLDKQLTNEGVAGISMGVMFNNSESRYVNYPLGADIFKAPGAGINYVHGGCSPQEMLVPLVDVKTEKAYREVKNAQLSLLSSLVKITNLIVSTDFLQTEPVSDVVKEAVYRLCFEDESGEKISNEHLVKTDKQDAESVKRIFRLRFSFKNKKYDRAKKYYLVISDYNSGMEVLRHEVMMDIACADDFGFFG